MKNPGRKTALILLLTLAVAGVCAAQKRSQNYQPSELSAQAAEAVLVDRFGISPASIARPVGAFMLAIRDDRGRDAEHFSVTLDKDGASELYSLDTTPNKSRGAVLVDLLAGKYRLRLKSSPNLLVAIEIK